MPATLEARPHTPITQGGPLTSDEWQQAWQSAYVFSLDLHPDLEIAWERDQWNALGAPSIGGLCERLLIERDRDAFSIPAELSADDLTALWHRLPRPDVMRWVQSGGCCLVAAMRLVWWLDRPCSEVSG